MEASSIDVRTILKNLNYPIAKKDIVQQAKKHGTSSEIIQILENLPDREYANAADVNKEFCGKFKSWG